MRQTLEEDQIAWLGILRHQRVTTATERSSTSLTETSPSPCSSMVEVSILGGRFKAAFWPGFRVLDFLDLEDALSRRVRDKHRRQNRFSTFDILPDAVAVGSI